MSEYQIETKCVQSGWQPKKGEPRVLPIYQSTTFKYDTSDQMGRLFDLEDSGYFYTRLQNPTNDFVAQKICELEGGAAAMLTSSGQAANYYAVFNICENGDHMVSIFTDIEDGIIVGCLPGRGQHRRCAAFELTDFLCHKVIRRILQPGIEISAVLQIKEPAHLVACIVFECRALINRQHPGFSFLWLPAGLDTFCLYLIFAHLVSS